MHRNEGSLEMLGGLLIDWLACSQMKPQNANGRKPIQTQMSFRKPSTSKLRTFNQSRVEQFNPKTTKSHQRPATKS